MYNLSLCENVSLDLSTSSIRYTLHPQLLVVIASVMCIVCAYIVGFNLLLILSLAYSRYHGKYINRTDRYTGFSDNKKILIISFSLIQLVIGGFCMPLAIVQVIDNGHWNLGPTFCTVRIYVESLSEVISIYHSVCMCLDTYTMVRKPFKYRLLTSKTGYGMGLFSWTIPVIVFTLALSLGWHTEGITEVLYCLEAYSTCIPIMSKKFLLFILPISVIISICTLIAVAALVLKEIHRFHKKQDLQNKRNNIGKSHSEAEPQPNPSGLHTIDKACKINETFHDLVAKFQSDVESEPTNRELKSEISVSVAPYELNETETRSVDNNTPKETVNVDNRSANVLPANSKSNSKRKAFGVVITLTAIQCIYLIAFVTFASLFVFNTKIFPLWLISYVTWLRYLHSASIPSIIFKHKQVRKIVRAFLKSFSVDKFKD